MSYFLDSLFAGKEADEETGLIYFGARYLDPQTSMWLSADPAMGMYVPAPGEDASELLGMGGVFNYVNLHTYHYAGNNPVKYIDPTGMWVPNEDGTFTAEKDDTLWDLYGANWKEKSGYTGDPKKLQIGETVGTPGKNNSSSQSGPSKKEAISNTNNVVNAASTIAVSAAIASGGQSSFHIYHGASGGINAMRGFPANPAAATALKGAKTVTKIAIAVAVGIGVYDAVNVGITTGNWGRAGFRLLGDVVEIYGSYVVGTVVTAGLTSGTVGMGVVPATIIGVTAAGLTAVGIDGQFNKWRNRFLKNKLQNDKIGKVVPYGNRIFGILMFLALIFMGYLGIIFFDNEFSSYLTFFIILIVFISNLYVFTLNIYYDTNCLYVKDIFFCCKIPFHSVRYIKDYLLGTIIIKHDENATVFVLIGNNHAQRKLAKFLEKNYPNIDISEYLV